LVLERISRAIPLPDDVIFTREAPVGEAFVIPQGMKICLGQRVMLIKPLARTLDSAYLVEQIYSGGIKNRISELTSGTTNPHLNVADVRSLLIALPSFAEQSAMKIRIKAISEKIQSQQRAMGKLQHQKSGLMHDLLTGKVPVTIQEVT
jgi:type I restriction enzyme, S subunit